MLTIDAEILEAIVAHARRDHPDEACGVVAGKIGSDRPERLVEMDNAERSSTFYRFDSMEQLRIWRDMDDRDEEPVHVVNAAVDPHAVQKYLFGQSPATVDYECPAGA